MPLAAPVALDLSRNRNFRLLALSLHSNFARALAVGYRNSQRSWRYMPQTYVPRLNFPVRRTDSGSSARTRGSIVLQRLRPVVPSSHWDKLRPDCYSRIPGPSKTRIVLRFRLRPARRTRPASLPGYKTIRTIPGPLCRSWCPANKQTQLAAQHYSCPLGSGRAARKLDCKPLAVPGSGSPSAPRSSGTVSKLPGTGLAQTASKSGPGIKPGIAQTIAAQIQTLRSHDLPGSRIQNHL